MQDNMLPKKLQKSPLVEAIWQVNFDVDPSLSVGNLLPGILYSELEGNKKGYKLLQLPFAAFPPAIADADENIKYQAKYRIESESDPYLYHIGEHMVSINCRTPYQGWNSFKNKILELVSVLQKTSFQFMNHKISLRYINFFPESFVQSLAAIFNIKLNIGSFEINNEPLQIRVGIKDDTCNHAVLLVNPAQLLLSDPNREHIGIIIDIETTLNNNTQNLFEEIQKIDFLHERNKTFFFTEILTKDTISRLLPVYDEE